MHTPPTIDDDQHPRPFRVRPKACGFRAGIDLTKLNQLADDLEIERAGGRFEDAPSTVLPS
jgi:hypothetical protein